ncbi:Tad domain-containing protein, partial [Ruegeria sp.]|uniref:TadE/TadG family type IV pilus assembly protein n=1 Tax=Ruegeria sp. TaxID=1879320 RepID=UPI0023285437
MKKFVCKSKTTDPRHTGRVSSRLRKFASSEDGSMTILVLFLFMTVLYAAGFAVDMMRYDRERVKLQYALDRAVLAAADLDQELCP